MADDAADSRLERIRHLPHGRLAMCFGVGTGELRLLLQLPGTDHGVLEHPDGRRHRTDFVAAAGAGHRQAHVTPAPGGPSWWSCP